MVQQGGEMGFCWVQGGVHVTVSLPKFWKGINVVYNAFARFSYFSWNMTHGFYERWNLPNNESERVFEDPNIDLLSAGGRTRKQCICLNFERGFMWSTTPLLGSAILVGRWRMVSMKGENFQIMSQKGHLRTPILHRIEEVCWAWPAVEEMEASATRPCTRKNLSKTVLSRKD